MLGDWQITGGLGHWEEPGLVSVRWKTTKELNRAKSGLHMCKKYTVRGGFTESRDEATENLGHHGHDLDQDAGGTKAGFGMDFKGIVGRICHWQRSQRNTFS